MGINWVLISYPIRVIHVIRATFCGLQLLLLLHMFCLFIAPTNTLACCHHRHKNAQLWSFGLIFYLIPQPAVSLWNDSRGTCTPLAKLLFYETRPSYLNKVTNTWMAPPSRQPIFLSDQKIQPATFQNKISKSSFNTLPRCHLSRVTQR